MFPLARDGFAGVRMASLGSDLVFGFQQVLFDLIILFFEGLGILDHFLGFLGWLRWGQAWFSVFNRVANRRADDSTEARPLESRRNLGPTY